MSPPVPSGLSVAGQILRSRLKNEAFVGIDNIDVIVGTPAEAAKKLQPSTPRSIVNLFFYRVEPSGFYPDASHKDRWFVRIRCLITVFSTAQPAQGNGNGGGMSPAISEGELDLRLLGEVLRYFHEIPVHFPRAEEPLDASLQVVFSQFTSEEINQIWSTQADTVYRPSVAYEIALVPIEPREYLPAATPVAAGGAEFSIEANMARARTPLEELAIPTLSPPRQEIDPTRFNWAPVLAFVAGGAASQSLSLDSPAEGAVVSLWIAGQPGETVTLVWRRSEKGEWREFEGAIGRVDVIIPAQPIVDPLVLDPADVADAALVPATLPTVEAGQYLLHGERSLDGGAHVAGYSLILTITGGGAS